MVLEADKNTYAPLIVWEIVSMKSTLVHWNIEWNRIWRQEMFIWSEVYWLIRQLLNAMLNQIDIICTAHI